MLQIGQQIEARVEKLVFHGKGLIRHEGWVIFVEDVAPGDKVIISITEKKKSYFVAKLVEVIDKSPLRVEPRCPYFGTCGGCQLQHLKYQAQVQAKEEWLTEALQRISGVTPGAPISVLPAPREWAYRRKVALHFDWSENAFHLGYFCRDNKTLLEVTSCPIFIPDEDPIFLHIRTLFTRFQGDEASKGDVIILKTDDGRYLVRILFEGALPENAVEALDHFYASIPPSIAKIWLESPKECHERGEHTLEIEVDSVKVEISPRVFVQNYPEQSAKLYREVIQLAEELSPGKPVLDLYCGVGILSMLLAKKGHEVLGIEYSKEAIQLAQKSAIKQKIANVSFRAGMVEEILRGALRSRSFPFWIVNPPRDGLSAVVTRDIMHFHPEFVVYISCMPTTLARDLRLLCQEMYSVVKVQGYDMFPETTHLETMVLLKRKA